MGTLIKDGDVYRSMNPAGPDWTLVEVIDMAILKATTMVLDDEIQGKGVIDALKGEWSGVGLSPKELQEVTRAYKRALQRAIIGLQIHLSEVI